MLFNGGFCEGDSDSWVPVIFVGIQLLCLIGIMVFCAMSVIEDWPPGDDEREHKAPISSESRRGVR